MSAPSESSAHSSPCGRYSTEAPATTYKQWVNKRTGEVERVAEGVHPAFNYHIGNRRQLESHSLIRDKVNASTSDLALGTVSSLVASQVFTDWFRQPAAGSRFVVAALDEDLKRRLGAKQKAVLLSDETLARHRKHHPELALAEYRLLPKIINTGMVIKEPDQRLVFFESKSIGKLYPTVAKTARFTAHYGNESQLTERALRAVTAVVSAIIRSHQRCDRETLRKTRFEPAMLARDALLSNFLCNTGVYMAVIKTTKNGDENYLASFRRTTYKDTQHKERQGRVIRKWKD